MSLNEPDVEVYDQYRDLYSGYVSEEKDDLSAGNVSGEKSILTDNDKNRIIEKKRFALILGLVVSVAGVVPAILILNNILIAIIVAVILFIAPYVIEMKNFDEKRLKHAPLSQKLEYSAHWKAREELARSASNYLLDKPERMKTYDVLLRESMFDFYPSVRKAAIYSLGQMLMQDHQRYASPVLMLPLFTSTELAKEHFKRGQNEWKSSDYYTYNRQIINRIGTLLKTEKENDVIKEAEKTLSLANDYF